MRFVCIVVLLAEAAKLRRATPTLARARVADATNATRQLRLALPRLVDQGPGDPGWNGLPNFTNFTLPVFLPDPSMPNLPGILPAGSQADHDLVTTLWNLGLAPLAPQNESMAPFGAVHAAAEFPYFNTSAECDAGPIPGLDLGYYAVGEPYVRVLSMNVTANASFTLPYWNQSAFGYTEQIAKDAYNDTLFAGFNQTNLSVYEQNYTFDLRDISCAPGNLQTRGAPTQAACVNGSWEGVFYYNQVVQKPKLLNCQSEEQVKLFKEIQFYLNWTEHEWADTDHRHFVWKDSFANFRKATLFQLHDAAHKLINDTTMDEWLSISDLTKVRDAFLEYRIQPRGEQFTQDTCEHFANHTLYAYPDPSTPVARFATSNTAPMIPEGSANWPDGGAEAGYTNKTRPDTWTKAVDWTCQYTSQKSAIGWDVLNHEPVIFYREGCYCESKMMLGCPFKYPGYAYAGFAGLEQKPVSGANGVSSLCWYWSDSNHPEWGYMREPAPGFGTGSALEAPAVNSTDLLTATPGAT